MNPIKRRTLHALARAIAHSLDRFPLLDRAVSAAMREIERDRVCSVDLTLQRADTEQALARPAVVQAMIGKAPDRRRVN